MVMHGAGLHGRNGMMVMKRWERRMVKRIAFCVILSFTVCFAIGGFSAGARADIMSGLAAYYQFNSTSGTSATDASGNGNTGTLSNATFTASGKFYYGYSATNTSARVTVADSASLGLTSFTIATWANFTTTTGSQYFMEKAVLSTADNYFFYWQTGTGYTCGFYDGATFQQMTVAGTPTTGTWAHFACTYDNTTKALKIYKDGTSIGTSTVSNSPVANTGSLGVGWNVYGGAGSFTGLLDDARLYSRALTASDITELYNYIPPNTTCSGPAGNGGDLTYDSAARKMAYCNSSSWVQIGAGPKGGGGCTNPVKSAGAIIYDSVNRVMKHCNGQEWATWGVVGGIGVASSCTSPTGAAGDLTYNADYRVMQYCDGKTWEMIGGYRPTLSMDFQADKYTVNGTVYSGIMTFLTAVGGHSYRSTTGTYFNSAGIMQSAATDTARLDYDPVTHEAKGILLEDGRTNLLKRSEAFDNVTWTKGDVTVTANTVVAPDGNTTADSVIATGSGPTFYSYIDQTATWSAGATLTRSVYAKAGSTSFVSFEQRVAGAYDYTSFDLSTGTVTQTGAGVTPSIQYVGNGWYRLIATRTFAAASGTNNRFGVIYVDVLTPPSTAGHNVYLWGAQLEVGSTASSYIPTTSATVTRTGDDMGIPVGTWYNQYKGTFVAKGVMPYMGANQYPGLISIDDGSSNNVMHLFIDDQGSDFKDGEIFVGGTNPFASNGSAYTAGNTLMMGMTYATNNVYIAADGVLSAQDTSVTIPTVTIMRPGSSRNGNMISGWVQGVQYYPFNVPGPILQGMTQHN
jgi:hypothetical protein